MVRLVRRVHICQVMPETIPHKMKQKIAVDANYDTAGFIKGVLS